MSCLAFKQHLAKLLPHDKLLHGLEGVIYTTLLSFLMPIGIAVLGSIVLSAVRETILDKQKDYFDVLACGIGSVAAAILLQLGAVTLP